MISAGTNEQIKKFINACLERCQSGDTWPPELADAIAIISGMDVDFNDSFKRMINREVGKTLAEKHTFHDIAYQCRTLLSEREARRLHRDTLTGYMRAEARGELKENTQPAIANYTVSNPIDDIRNGHKAKSLTAKSLQDRINRIQKSKQDIKK